MNELIVADIGGSEPLSDEEREWLPLVSVQRQERIARLQNTADRRQHLYAALLVRSMLCKALGVPNGALRFAATVNGKPYLVGAPQVQFNVSHTHGAVAAALSDAPVGVDIERLRPVNPRLAERCFTEREAAYVAAASGEELNRRFFEVWTKKEAVVKCRGERLGPLLRSLDVLHDPTVQTQSLECAGCVLSVCAAAPQLTPTTLTREQLAAFIRSRLQ